MSCGCLAGVLQCQSGVLRVSCGRLAGVLRVSCGCLAGVRVSCGCLAGVSRVSRVCLAGVLRVSCALPVSCNAHARRQPLPAGTSGPGVRTEPRACQQQQQQQEWHRQAWAVSSKPAAQQASSSSTANRQPAACQQSHSLASSIAIRSSSAALKPSGVAPVPGFRCRAARRHELPPHGPPHCGLAPEVGGARPLRLLVAYVLLASSTRTTTYLCRFCLCIVCARGGFAQILFAAHAMSRFHAAPQGHQKATRRSEDTGLSDM